ncbi:MAG: DUF4331 domain-containing protein [Chloroflexi bacterium]|nr:DUF4331 domain-containing protein [Chloroflexota bacterium]
MSSHREAPGIAADPVADNTDLYAFVSPDAPSSVTIIANYIPLEDPAGGPNFFNFGDDVLYRILIDNDADARPDIVYEFRFRTRIANPSTFLYNTGPIGSLTDATWNFRQTYSVTRIAGARRTTLGEQLPCPPVHIGPRSTPNYASALAAPAVSSLPGGRKVFAGQRADGFYVDLGSIFDLAALRPLQSAHLINMPPNAAGRNGLMGFNVHSIALQVPKSDLTRDGSMPSNAADAKSVIGVWATASRQKAMVRWASVEDNESDRDDAGDRAGYSAGPWVQVSRLGNPLINEVVIPLGVKDRWNALAPARDSGFAQYYEKPELAGLLPVLYPGAFPKLDALHKSGKPRADLVAVLLTGIPSGLIPGFQNFTGQTKADMLRLNMAIPPTAQPNKLGLVGGDAAGYPNGRRVTDDVVAISLRAVAGAVYPLIDATFSPDAVVGMLADGTAPDPAAPFLAAFPYLGTPYSGFDHRHDAA